LSDQFQQHSSTEDVAAKEIIVSIKELMDEIKITISSSNKS
jgi:hypothetical protein